MRLLLAVCTACATAGTGLAPKAPLQSHVFCTTDRLHLIMSISMVFQSLMSMPSGHSSQIINCKTHNQIVMKLVEKIDRRVPLAAVIWSFPVAFLAHDIEECLGISAFSQ